MDVVLSPEEVRVMGCLMEKAVTTPEQYPLTLNALTNACNQKSSREPVMDLPQGVVQRTARGLEDKTLVTRREGQRQGVEKYSQRLCNTPLAKFRFSEAEYAVVCVLMLRGAQTPGELRTRTQRLYGFADNQEVIEVLKALMEREAGAVVARLPRKSGRQDHEYLHLFAGEIASAPEDTDVAPRPSAPRQADRIDALEARIAQLESSVQQLASRLGEPLENS
ncbi:MAG TPA: YceH family protein [Pseudomonadales bacterium]|nr:YceH family protein [Pseudomonadales bacterium]